MGGAVGRGGAVRRGGAWAWAWAWERATGSILPFPLCAVLLLLFNLADGVFTMVYLELQVATELNPLMRWAYEGSPVLFMAVKQTAVGAGVLMLTLAGTARAARVALQAAAALYAALVAYHLAFAVRLWA